MMYAINIKSKRENDKFAGFEVNGVIEPLNYALCEKLLFEKEDNMFSIQLRTAYKVLTNKI